MLEGNCITDYFYCLITICVDKDFALSISVGNYFLIYLIVFQIGIQQVVQRIEHLDPPGEVFRAIVQNAGQLHCNGSGREDLVSELCSDEDLADVSTIPLWFVMLYNSNYVLLLKLDDYYIVQILRFLSFWGV